MRLEITGRKVDMSEMTMVFVERRMRFALTRFAPSISDVAVTLSDESGPHGAPAKRCQIAVGMKPNGSVVVDAVDTDFQSAASRAAERAGRSVSRHLERKRDAKRQQRRRAARNSENDPLLA